MCYNHNGSKVVALVNSVHMKGRRQMALSTKQALAESFKRLLLKRGVEKITVKDIVEDCGVNRQTFYYHFRDIYDLMEWIFQEATEKMAQEVGNCEDEMAGLDSMISYLQENRLLLLHAYHLVDPETVIESIRKMLRPYILRIVRSQAEGLVPPAKQEDIEFITDVFNVAVSGSMTEWVSERESAAQTQENLRKLRVAIDGSARFMLRKLSRDRQN